MKTITKSRCPCCGRKNSPFVTRTVEQPEGGPESLSITAPWCPETTGFGKQEFRCKPYSPEERDDPGIKDYWTKRYEWGGAEDPYEEIDAGIRGMVKECHSLGLATCFSCDGHGNNGYILFYSLEDAKKYLDILSVRYLDKYEDDVPVVIQPRPHRLLGEIYCLRIHKDVLEGSPRMVYCRKCSTAEGVKRIVRHAAPACKVEET